MLFVGSLNAQHFKYGVTGNFHKGSIVNVHDKSIGNWGGGLGFFVQWPLVENDIFDSAWLYLMPQIEYSMQGEKAKVHTDVYGKQIYDQDYVAMQVYLKWFFHKGNMKRDLYLFAGPRIEYMVREKKETSALYEAKHYNINRDDKIDKFGYGVSFGAGLRLSDRLETFIRYDRGFSKVYPDNSRNNYNRLLGLGVNYYIRYE